MQGIKNYMLATFLLLITGLISCNSNANTEEVALQQTNQNTVSETLIPSFKMKDAKGNPVNLTDFKGKKVFVNIWATWCPPCRAEIPSIEELYRQADKNKSVFIMLSVDNDFETALSFAKNKNLQTPVFYPSEEIPQLFNTGSIPTTFIFNEEGKLIMQETGARDYNVPEYIQLFQ